MSLKFGTAEFRTLAFFEGYRRVGKFFVIQSGNLGLADCYITLQGVGFKKGIFVLYKCERTLDNRQELEQHSQ